MLSVLALHLVYQSENPTGIDRKHKKGQTIKDEWCHCCSYGNRCISH